MVGGAGRSLRLGPLIDRKNELDLRQIARLSAQLGAYLDTEKRGGAVEGVDLTDTWALGGPHHQTWARNGPSYTTVSGRPPNPPPINALRHPCI